MKALRLALLLFAVAGWACLSPAYAQSSDEMGAEAAAGAYVDHLDFANLDQVYDNDLSDSFKVLMARKAFIDLISVARIQAGGAHTARSLVGSHGFSQAPTGQTGEFYYVRFRTVFPSAVVFQDVYLQKIGDRWKITGSLSLPAQ